MDTNIIVFPIIPRPIPRDAQTAWRVTVVKDSGERIIATAFNKKNSMELVLEMLRTHPDAKRISVMKEIIQ